MKLLFVAALFIASIAIASAIIIPHDEPHQVSAFLDFMHKFNKSYSTPDETLMRFKVFTNNMLKIEELRNEYKNLNGVSGEDVIGVTKFSDMTFEEFGRFKGFTPRARRNNIPVQEATSNAAPDKWDWRDEKKVTPVKDQGQCGSCWAFSATEEIESSWAMEGNALTELSVQQTVSCDTVDGGCNGGDTITAYQYVEQAGGVELGSAYPYSSGNGDTGSCKFKKADVKVTVSNYSYATNPCSGSCNNQDETTLKSNLYAEGPVSICLNANDAWQFYTSGIFASSCPHAYSDLDHCVQLVGYDASGSTPYWIIRNSWNTDWGVSGYIWLKMGSNLCGVADEATLVKTKAA